MSENWKKIWGDKPKDEIIREMSSKVKYFTEHFTMEEFYKCSNPIKEDFIAAILITPRQVMIGVSNGFNGTLSHLEGIINPLIRESGASRFSNLIEVHLVSSPIFRCCYQIVEYGEENRSKPRNA